MFFRPRRQPSLITGGTRLQREVLALLIERGLQMEGESLYRREFSHPRTDAPLDVVGFSAFFGVWSLSANLVGFALMGVADDDRSMYDVQAEYLQYCARLNAARVSPKNAPYHAVAEMLGLPVELLLKTQLMNNFGADYNGVLDELRGD